MQKFAPMSHHHLLQIRELPGRYLPSAWLWHPLLSLRELTQLVQSSMWQRATDSAAFPNNYSPFCWCWETQGYSPSAQPLEECNYVLEMHCLEQSLLWNGNYQLKLEIRKRKFLSVSPCLLEPPASSTSLLLSFLPKACENQGKKSLFLSHIFIVMFKCMKL